LIPYCRKVTPFELKRKADKKFSGKDAVCGSGKLGTIP
jgi:hypothetical protein